MFLLRHSFQPQIGWNSDFGPVDDCRRCPACSLFKFGRRKRAHGRKRFSQSTFWLNVKHEKMTGSIFNWSGISVLSAFLQTNIPLNPRWSAGGGICHHSTHNEEGFTGVLMIFQAMSEMFFLEYKDFRSCALYSIYSFSRCSTLTMKLVFFFLLLPMSCFPDVEVE